jgi:hypothetical protein
MGFFEDPFARKGAGKLASRTFFAGNNQFSAMPIEHVFHDRKS